MNENEKTVSVTMDAEFALEFHNVLCSVMYFSGKYDFLSGDMFNVLNDFLFDLSVNLFSE